MIYLSSMIGFIAGLACGVGIYRYAFGQGIRSVERIRDDLPVFGRENNTIAAPYTGDVDEKEDMEE